MVAGAAATTAPNESAHGITSETIFWIQMWII